MRKHQWLLAGALPVLLAGCEIGSTYTAAVTVDALGLNLQSAPSPTAQIAYTREEGAIEPVFENGKTPAIAASVQHTGNGSLMKLGDDVKSVFAGGNAAILASGTTPSASGIDAVACLTKPVNQSAVFDTGASGSANARQSGALFAPGSSAPMFFGTDSAIGLKVAFAGASTGGMSSAVLGYRRYEVSIAPVFGVEGGCSHDALMHAAQTAVDQAQAALDTDNKTPAAARTDAQAATAAADALALKAAQDHLTALNALKPGDTGYQMYSVQVPSTLAVANDSVNTNASGGTNGVGLSIAQVFATGKAAEAIAQAKGVAGSIATVAAPAATGATGPNFTVAVTGTTGAPAGTAVSLGFTAPVTATLGNTSTSIPLSESYSTSLGDSAPTIATKLAGQINANTSAKLLGITATANGATLSLKVPAALAQYNLDRAYGWTSAPLKDSAVTLTASTTTASN